MSDAHLRPGPVWIKAEWKLRTNPFPSTGIVRLGGRDAKENGLLYAPEVHAEELRQVVEKFVLRMSYSGLKFGYLWSEGLTAGESDARGFGKSVLMQHVAREINCDFGEGVYQSAGLDAEDAAEVPICCVVTGFDTAQVRTLGAALFGAVEYAVNTVTDGATLAARLQERLVAKTGTKDARQLASLVAKGHSALRGRTLGRPDDKLIAALCDSDPSVAADYLSQITPTTRARAGSVHMATFLLFAAAAGIDHVLVFCDQLEDLASTTTAKAKRDLEVERFRDLIVETLPMADMVTMILAMHPRTAVTIGQAWDLADLPSFALTESNAGCTVRLRPLRDAGQAAQLLKPYLQEATKEGVSRPEDELFPFTQDAIMCLFVRSNRRPRDLLRKAHAILEASATRNLSRITADDVMRFLDATVPVPRDSFGRTPSVIDWSQE
ncbi:hypothetical protein ACFV10_07315 [Streptomyces cyaneofuscatus]|uniref:hypothetical protein n=1 Tax=Streptomyces cyaneofuscatus TaxID=66883 RepID=UPI00367780F9